MKQKFSESDSTGSLELLVQQAIKGDGSALAKLLTLMERNPALAWRHPQLLNLVRPGFRIGITGPPGSGKSTLINGIIWELKKKYKKIGVLSVDPSSPFTKGAILGDRLRYSDHFTDSQIFIRSLASRGHLGGLAASSYAMCRVMEACGFEIIILETVGVGQSELEIMNVADRVIVVLVPESGDSIQLMKAGVLEIADIFVLNKADRPGADFMMAQLEAEAKNSRHSVSPPVLKTIAHQFFGGQHLPEHEGRAGQQATGIRELTQTTLSLKHSETRLKKNRVHRDRLRAEARAVLRFQLNSTIEDGIDSVQSPADLAKFPHL